METEFEKLFKELVIQNKLEKINLFDKLEDTNKQRMICGLMTVFVILRNGSALERKKTRHVLSMLRTFLEKVRYREQFFEKIISELQLQPFDERFEGFSKLESLRVLKKDWIERRRRLYILTEKRFAKTGQPFETGLVSLVISFVN